MSPARRHRGVTGQDRRQAHIDWLKLIEVSGPFLSVPVLTAEWPDLEPLEVKERDRLRQEHRQWQERPAAHRDDWIGYILDDLLGWQGAVQHDDLARLTLDVPEHETAITPSFALTDPGTGDLRLLGLVSDDSPVARIKGSDWPATPADRLAQLCRHHGVELGLATDGRWWALVWAPAGGVTTVAVFDAISWPDLSERTVLRAFISLLQRRRFFAVPPERRLPTLLRESLNNQEEITDRLGIQVRQAVELLVAAFGRADISADVTAYEVYRGAVAVMMRIVFLLFAEESGLLPADNELYAHAYSAGGLYTELEQRVADARGNEGELEHTVPGLAPAPGPVHRRLPGRVPSRARPDCSRRLAVRPGRPPLAPADRRRPNRPAHAPRGPDRHHRRRAAHGLVPHPDSGTDRLRLRRPALLRGFPGRRDGRRPDRQGRPRRRGRAADAGEHRRGTRFRGNARRQARRTLQELRHRLPPSADHQASPAHRRRARPGRDPPIRRHPRPPPSPALAALLPDHPPGPARRPGSYPPRRPLRHRVGAACQHRHPLHAQIPRRAGRRRRLGTPGLLPGPLQSADCSLWKLRPAENILALRVTDIAMGSGAFLVAACRYLAGKLIEAWSATGNIDAQLLLAEPPVESGLALDVAADPLIIKARREIIEHCLYGIDINPMAVEMAKLSLWLVSMDPHRPFTFLDDRLAAGDSLLGITTIDQLEWMHLDPKAGRRLHEGALLDFMSGVRSLLAEVTEQRVNLANLPDDTFADLTKKRQLLTEVQAKTKQLSLYADLIVGATLASSGKGGLWLTAAKLANEAAAQGAVKEADKQAEKWLSTGQPDGAFDRDPLHWPLVFPEVFNPNLANGPGFDAVIGNPPFLGGSKITGPLGVPYRETIIEIIASGVRAGGRCDLIAYFVLRAHSLLNTRGQTGSSRPIHSPRAIPARSDSIKSWHLALRLGRQSRASRGHRGAPYSNTRPFGQVRVSLAPELTESLMASL